MSDEIVNSISYDGPCPVGHPATWTSTQYEPSVRVDIVGDYNRDYTLATVECSTCQAAPTFTAVFVGGPHHDVTFEHIRQDTTELTILDGSRYVRRPHGIYFDFRAAS